MTDAEKLRLGQEKTIVGVLVVARRLRETRSSDVKPGKTAWHEAGHVYLLIKRRKTLRGAEVHGDGGNIRGSTAYDGEFDVVVAAGGAALGDHEGATGDRIMASRHRADWKNAISTAQNEMMGDMHVIRALASALEAAGELDGDDLYDVYEEARNGAEVVIRFTLPDGHEREETTRTEVGSMEVRIPGHIFLLLIDAVQKERARKEEEKIRREEQPPALLPDTSDLIVESDLRKAA